jgi:hypothetical protein
VLSENPTGDTALGNVLRPCRIIVAKTSYNACTIMIGYSLEKVDLRTKESLETSPEVAP